jgi:hypothetical protein
LTPVIVGLASLILEIAEAERERMSSPGNWSGQDQVLATTASPDSGPTAARPQADVVSEQLSWCEDAARQAMSSPGLAAVVVTADTLDEISVAELQAASRAPGSGTGVGGPG